MIFVIGGENQGKLEYVLNLKNLDNNDVADCSYCSEEDIADKKIIYNFNLLIKRMLKEYEDSEIVKEKVKEILDRNEEAVIISNEIGYGVVPIDSFDRQYRELTGRISCDIAKKAEQVHRVICGIGTVIKGDRCD